MESKFQADGVCQCQHTSINTISIGEFPEMKLHIVSLTLCPWEFRTNPLLDTVDTFTTTKGGSRIIVRDKTRLFSIPARLRSMTCLKNA